MLFRGTVGFRFGWVQGLSGYIGSIGFVTQRNDHPGVQKIEAYTIVL